MIDPGFRLRKIIHVDMDAFYASVEQLDDPRLRGRPVVVGGPPTSRSVVCAASYEARPFGVHSAMPCAQAQRLCPGAIFVAPRFTRYTELSRQIREIFYRYTPLVEPLSLDEAYLDVTVNLPNIPHATRIAKQIRREIHAETGLTASAGVAPNKFLAKVASDHNKPDGLCVVTPERVAEFLRGLPVRKLPGVGPVTAERFARLGIERVEQILALDELALARHFGKSGPYFLALARGVDERPVLADRTRRSVGVEETYERDVTSLEEARARLPELARELERRVERAGFRGRTLTLKVRYADFRRITRSRTLGRAITSRVTALEHAAELLLETDVGRLPARLLGLSISHAEEGPEQLSLPFGAPGFESEPASASEPDLDAMIPG